MKTRLQIMRLVVLLLLLATPSAAAALATDFDLQIATGIREDRLDWSISGSLPDNGSILPARSELTWDNLRIWEVRTRGTLTLAADAFPQFTPVVRGEAGYGWIRNGRNRDSDYVLVDSEFVEFSRSNNRADSGNVVDLSLGVGAQFQPDNGRVTLTPLLGYSYHEQNLRITDGFQTISFPGQPTGPFPGLDSSYEAEWRGPWIGLDADFQPLERVSLSGNLQYHWADFQAVADWNLRTDFQHPVSFTHDANASGFKVSAAAAFELVERWSVELSYDYREWQTAAGIHRFFFVDGVAAVPLNKVNWTSQSLSIGLHYRF
jgi:opacity protein-like surface antigen